MQVSSLIPSLQGRNPRDLGTRLSHIPALECLLCCLCEFTWGAAHPQVTDCTKLGRIVFQIKILLAAKSKPFRKLYAKIFLLQLIGILIVTNEGWKREKTNPQIKIFEVCLPILLRLCCPTLYCAIPKWLYPYESFNVKMLCYIFWLEKMLTYL